MNILMLLSKPYVHDGRVIKEAQALTNAGHHVRVLQWARQDPDAPAQERIDGVDVHRINTGSTGGRPGPTMQWWRRAARACKAWSMDAVHAHDLDTLPAGAWIARRHYVPLIYDSHEHFPEMIRSDQPAWLSWIADRLERRLLRRVDHVITVNEPLAARFRRIGKTPVTIVMNTPELPPMRPRSKDFHVSYIGTLHADRLLPAAVLALASAGIPLVIGGKKENLYDEVAGAARQTGTRFLGPVPFDEVMPRTQDAHAVMCMLDPHRGQNRWVTATKVFDAMAAGRPSIVAAGTPSAAIVAEKGCGLVVPYGTRGLVEAARRLRDDPRLAEELGARGRVAAEEEYSWRRQAERLVAVYSRAL